VQEQDIKDAFLIKLRDLKYIDCPTSSIGPPLAATVATFEMATNVSKPSDTPPSAFRLSLIAFSSG